MNRLVIVSTAIAALLSSAASAQPRGGILRVRLVNGTTGGQGAAEKITLFRLSGGMVPLKELGPVEGAVTIEDIEVEGERPMLLQANYRGVSYNEPVLFGRGYEAEVELTVYEVVEDWDEARLELASARYVYRRQGDRLLVDKIYVVQNRTEPPLTYYNPNGTFRFGLPSSELLELHSVSAQGSSGMPVPQQASPLPGGEGYVTKTAFKPGETEIVASYSVSYAGGSYRLDERTFYDHPETYVFTAPPDITVDAEGWEDLGTEPQGRFAAIRKLKVPRGSNLSVVLRGGSDAAVDAPSEVANESPRGSVTRIPDTTRAAKWIVITLMAAALGYGLLATVLPPRSEDQGD
ncbi:MAG TPA: hypothetical protein VLK65_13890 [Vicinamibacteria bacterium]|nr:hypothetical protein [Vicinamibacteria bacterium]